MGDDTELGGNGSIAGGGQGELKWSGGSRKLPGAVFLVTFNTKSIRWTAEIAELKAPGREHQWNHRLFPMEVEDQREIKINEF